MEVMHAPNLTRWKFNPPPPPTGALLSGPPKALKPRAGLLMTQAKDAELSLCLAAMQRGPGSALYVTRFTIALEWRGGETQSEHLHWLAHPGVLRASSAWIQGPAIYTPAESRDGLAGQVWFG